jgi:hypothetical protein
LRGFFSPVLLGAMKQNLGCYASGFVTLSLFSLARGVVCCATERLLQLPFND